MKRRQFISLAAAGCTTLAIPFTKVAQAKTGLVVYTSWENDDLGPFKSNFEKANPEVAINWVRDSTGVIAAKLIAEKNRPHADAIWGMAITTMALLADQGVLAPYSPDNLSHLAPKFKDHNNPPRWFGNTAWATAIIFNTAEAGRHNIPKPEHWSDLTRPEYKGQIVMPHPASSGTGYMYVAAWLQLFGHDKGWAFMDKLNENVARYMHSGSAPGVEAARGEYLIGLSFDVRGSRLKQEGAPIDLIFPSEGLGWDMQTFGIVNGTPKLTDAEVLANWAASKDAMEMYGSARSVTAMPGTAKKLPFLPDNFEDHLIDQDFAWSAKERSSILSEWEKRYGYKADPKKK